MRLLDLPFHRINFIHRIHNGHIGLELGFNSNHDVIAMIDRPHI